MKSSVLPGLAAVLAAVCSARATLVVNNTYSSFNNGGVIPTGNAAGFTDSESVSGVTDLGSIDNVTVSLNISGGFNGDLYGYLVYQPSGGGSTTTAVLLNRPGLGTGGPVQTYFGYSDPGMNVTLNDATTLTSIDNYGGGGVPTGTFNSAGGTLNTAFGGVSTVNGKWTLALFDLTSGGSAATLTSWGLSVSEVPEPVTWALIIFGALSVPVVLVKRRMQSAGD
jgi:hypothetical protein